MHAGLHAPRDNQINGADPTGFADTEDKFTNEDADKCGGSCRCNAFLLFNGVLFLCAAFQDCL
jgi:hypothetical protein